MPTHPFESRGLGAGEHPVDHFWAILDQLKVNDYPQGVEPIRPSDRIPGTAFFSAGSGLIRSRGQKLPPFPYGGVMFVGHNLDSEESYRRHLANGSDHGDPDHPTMRTWTNFYALMSLAGIDRSEIFCTNYFVGLKGGEGATGAFPGRLDVTFCAWCESFLDEQIQLMRPRVVVALGKPARRRLGLESQKPTRCRRGDVEFVGLALMHPSSPAYYQHLEGGQRISVEAAALREL
jgi:hypothetical protein